MNNVLYLTTVGTHVLVCPSTPLATYSTGGHIHHSRPLTPLAATYSTGGHLLHWRPLTPLATACSTGGRLLHWRPLTSLAPLRLLDRPPTRPPAYSTARLLDRPPTRPPAYSTAGLLDRRPTRPPAYLTAGLLDRPLTSICVHCMPVQVVVLAFALITVNGENLQFNQMFFSTLIFHTYFTFILYNEYNMPGKHTFLCLHPCGHLYDVQHNIYHDFAYIPVVICTTYNTTFTMTLLTSLWSFVRRTTQHLP